MLNDLIYFVSSIPLNIKMWMFVPFLVFDGTRYTIATAVMCIYDALCAVWRSMTGSEAVEDWDYCPSVAVMIVCPSCSERRHVPSCLTIFTPASRTSSYSFSSGLAATRTSRQKRCTSQP